MTAIYLANFDGACGRNPGGAGGWGFIIFAPDGTELKSGFGSMTAAPSMTNNVAEYVAALECLRAFVGLDRPGQLVLRGDSQMVIAQMTGRKRVLRGAYVDAYLQVRAFVDAHDLDVEWRWVPREDNARADALSKTGLAASHRIEIE